VTSPELVTFEPAVTVATFEAEPTNRLPTDVVEAVAGKVTAESKEVEKGSKIKLPAVFTLNAAELELE
jgi:hypothetical protein